VLSSGLGDIVDVREKAVLMHCLHVFCVDCLNRWLPVKRLCPLCKVRPNACEESCTCCRSCRHTSVLTFFQTSVASQSPAQDAEAGLDMWHPAKSEYLL